MRRGRILIFVLLILIIGLVVVALAIRQFLISRTPKAPASVDVYIAGQNIPQGGRIEENMLSTASLPQAMALDVYFTVGERAELLNNKVARYPLGQGHIISSADVQDASTAVAIGGPQWAALIPPGMTAISIPTTRLSLAGYGIDDGAHVNVNGCFLFVDVDPSFQSILPDSTAVITGTGIVPDTLPVLSMSVSAGGPQGRLELDPSLQQPFFLIPSEGQRPRMVCQMLLQDVVVMKLGNFPLTTATTAENPAQAASPDIVTLIVSPQDSVTLSYLIYANAEIVMTLRNPSDQARQATEASTLQFLLSQYNIPVPAKLPYAMQPAISALSAPALPNDIVTVPAQ
jgi:Flp pilus assembly protein CpaB